MGKQQASRAAPRTLGLQGRTRTLLADVAKAYARGDLPAAWIAWLAASRTAPGHAEILYWSGAIALADGRAADAVTAFREALAACPVDVELRRCLGDALVATGADDDGLAAWRDAATKTHTADGWLDLGLRFDRHGHSADALAAADSTLALAPDRAQARLLRARCLQALGDAAGAAAEYRRLLARRQAVARAWFGLLDIKTEAIGADELQQLERDERAATSPDERDLLGFALGRAQETYARHDEAFATFTRANDAVATRQRWDAAAFAAQVSAIDHAFRDVPVPQDTSQPTNVVFIVGLPRSGSTLIEQVLAAHPRVEAASELPHLGAVIAQESHRRGAPLAAWAPRATAADWQRLGAVYLARTHRWRATRPVSTDKLPSNWLFAGAALAMLPGARIVDCTRDPLEIAWSCYKQLFAPGMADYTYRFDDLAAYMTQKRWLARQWAMRAPARYRAFRYEDLVQDAEPFVRELLAFCGLPFDAACLAPHRAQRSIRTASSAQVRQPLRRLPRATDAYADQLAPLRALLQDPQDD